MWLRLIFLAAVAGAAWFLFRPRWAFTIVVGPTGVISYSGIKTSQQRQLLQLFENVRFMDGQVTIRGRCDADGRLRLHFSGPIDSGTQQQIRNLLTTDFS
jgi:hypothetical protein